MFRAVTGRDGHSDDGMDVVPHNEEAGEVNSHPGRSVGALASRPPAPVAGGALSAESGDGLIAGLVDIAIPVYNEEASLESSVRELDRYLDRTFPHDYVITIVDNASEDGTYDIGSRLADAFPHVRYLRLDKKGKGLAVRHAWTHSHAEVVAYMDVDLATDLRALAPLVAPLFTMHSELAIGSRLMPGAKVVRGRRREVISRVYNTLLRGVMAAQFTDAQCGFKAARTETVRELLPLVEDDGWFFDAELLLIAESHGLRIHEVPVDWTDDPDSRVNVRVAIANDLRGMIHVSLRSLKGEFFTPVTVVTKRSLPWQLVVFSIVGFFSTLMYSGLFMLLRDQLGLFEANTIALLLTAMVNAAANRRFTFGVRGPNRLRHQLEAGVAFSVALIMSTVCLVIASGHYHATGGNELVIVVFSGFVVTAFRFILFREWVFNPSRVAAWRTKR